LEDLCRCKTPLLLFCLVARGLVMVVRERKHDPVFQTTNKFGAEVVKCGGLRGQWLARPRRAPSGESETGRAGLWVELLHVDLAVSSRALDRAQGHTGGVDEVEHANDGDWWPPSSHRLRRRTIRRLGHRVVGTAGGDLFRGAASFVVPADAGRSMRGLPVETAGNRNEVALPSAEQGRAAAFRTRAPSDEVHESRQSCGETPPPAAAPSEIQQGKAKSSGCMDPCDGSVKEERCRGRRVGSA